MNQFTTPLDVRRLDTGNRWEILAPFEFRLGAPDGPEYVRVPVGFVTDFASIPFPISRIFPPIGKDYDKPAVVHDCLYLLNYVQHVNGGLRRIERDEADAIFLAGMVVRGVHLVTRRTIWSGVRAGGWRPWRQYRAAEAGARMDEDRA